jgi:hypothetical protein
MRLAVAFDPLSMNSSLHLTRGTYSTGVAAEHLTSVFDQRPATAEHLTSVFDQRPATAEHLTTEFDQRPATAEHLTTVFDQRPAVKHFDHGTSVSVPGPLCSPVLDRQHATNAGPATSI